MKSSTYSALDGLHPATPRQVNDSATSPPVHTARAAALFEEIAALALRVDRHCHFEHDSFEDPDCDGLIVAERACVELAYLRDVIRRLGWTADLGCDLLRDAALGQVRGGAEDWILSPAFSGAREGVAHG